jgi:hypothetical protein
MLAWLDAWEGLLPPPALAHVLLSLVLPRLAAAVEKWDPRQETVPIHAWLHPWLPHLGPQLEAFYPTIRHRLSSALTAWHPADDSARALLAPWRRAFDAGDWDALLARSVAPKLALALQVRAPGVGGAGPALAVHALCRAVPASVTRAGDAFARLQRRGTAGTAVPREPNPSPPGCNTALAQHAPLPDTRCCPICPLPPRSW